MEYSVHVIYIWHAQTRLSHLILKYKTTVMAQLL